MVSLKEKGMSLGKLNLDTTVHLFQLPGYHQPNGQQHVRKAEIKIDGYWIPDIIKLLDSNIVRGVINFPVV